MCEKSLDIWRRLLAQACEDGSDKATQQLFGILWIHKDSCAAAAQGVEPE